MKKNVVTQNVPPNTENVTKSDLLEVLRGLSKEELLGVLAEVLKDR
ncbi:MAG TPA: hypothetical protein PKO23_19775 [Candidatus Hydrogenedentes bacterium]|nr:hypothetical protein [Candidatus Hydrogenedentota bacterium]